MSGLPGLAAAVAAVVLSDADVAVPFMGVGAISGGGATGRLLFDYPEPARSAVLDLLFSPRVGVGLGHQKVECAADADTTCGSEVAWRHDEGDGGSFTRGYEWWYLAEARVRNPSILTSALQWAAPRLVSDPAVAGGESIFTPANVDFVVGWLKGAAATYNLTLTWMGAGWNEHAFNATYIKLLRAAMDASGLASTALTASDEWDPSHCWAIASEMAADPALRAAVAAISVHVAGVMEHGDPTPAGALGLGVPILQGEEHFGLPDPVPTPNWAWGAAAATGVQINQNWVLNNMSGTVYWPDAYSWAAGLPYRGKGFMTATSPWGDGIFFVPPTVWVAAHTTHFTEPLTWSLLNGTGSGHVPGTVGWNVSYVTYVGPAPANGARRAFTLVIESMYEGAVSGSRPAAGAAAAAPVTATFQLAGGLAGWANSTLPAWHTNMTQTFETVPGGVAIAADGTFSLTIEPSAIYTVTTVVSDHPGARALLATYGPTAVMVHGDGTAEVPADPARGRVPLGDDGPADEPFPLPWADDFEGYANDTLPLFTSDMYGAFTTWVVGGASSSSSSSSSSPQPQPPAPLRDAHPDPAVRAAVPCRTAADAALRPGRCQPPGGGASAGAGAGAGTVLRQYVRQPPIGWASSALRMATILGNYSLTAVALNVSALIETPAWPGVRTGMEAVFLGVQGGSGRVGGSSPSFAYGAHVDAYTLEVAVNGTWAVTNSGAVLAAGALPAAFGYDTWHELSLSVAPAGALVAAVDGAVVATVPAPPARNGGYAVVGTGCHTAQFDNLVLASTAA
jgi:hypothetical protein